MAPLSHTSLWVVTLHFTRSMVWFSVVLATCASWRQAGFRAELCAMLMPGPLLLSPEVNFCPHSSAILKIVHLVEKKFGLPLAPWDRYGNTKPGYQMVVLHWIFSSELLCRPSPHHNLLKQFNLLVKLKCVVQVLSINKLILLRKSFFWGKLHECVHLSVK